MTCELREFKQIVSQTLLDYRETYDGVSNIQSFLKKVLDGRRILQGDLLQLTLL